MKSFIVERGVACGCGCGGVTMSVVGTFDDVYVADGKLPADIAKPRAKAPRFLVGRCLKAKAKLYVDRKVGYDSVFYIRTLDGTEIAYACSTLGKKYFGNIAVGTKRYITYERTTRKTLA